MSPDAWENGAIVPIGGSRDFRIGQLLENATEESPAVFNGRFRVILIHPTLEFRHVLLTGHRRVLGIILKWGEVAIKFAKETGYGDADGPQVGWLAEPVPAPHLRGYVPWRPARRRFREGHTADIHGKVEVRDDESVFLVMTDGAQDVAGLDVAVDYTLTVQVLDTLQNLASHLDRIRPCDVVGLGIDQVLEIAAGGQVLERPPSLPVEVCTAETRNIGL